MKNWWKKDKIPNNSIFYLSQNIFQHINPLPDNKISDWSKLKWIEDDIFKFDENIRKFSKRVENTVGKREIARYEQFLLFPQCFQKACFLAASKGVIVWEWIKGKAHHHTHTTFVFKRFILHIIMYKQGLVWERVHKT